MAQKTTIDYVDDLDGVTTADQPSVPFSLDGVEYEIDLSDANAERLRTSLQQYIENARRTGGRLKPPSGVKKASADSAQIQHMREWGRENGFTVSDRGRLPVRLTDAYHAAQEAKAEAAKAEAAKPATAKPAARRKSAKAKPSA
jgi:hypothetical protein